jgi:hypothetical protein
LLIDFSKPLFYISPAAGAATSVYLATAPLAAIQAHAGGYFTKSKPARIQNGGATAANARRLWDQSISYLEPHLRPSN